MKKIISLTAVLLMLSFAMVDSNATLAGGGPVTPVPTRRVVPTPEKTTPAQPTTPATPSVPASNPASAPAATVPMGYSGYPSTGYPYSSNIGPCNYGNCSNFGNFGNYGVCGSSSAGYGQSYDRNRGTVVVVDCGNNNCERCSGNFGCRGGRCLVARLLNQGNIAGARAVLRSINRSLYFGDCAGAC